MSNALLAKNKFGFVDGTLLRPEPDSADLAIWIKNNSMIISWIFNSLDSSLHDSVVFFDTAREIWVDLEERLSQGNAPRVHQLRTEIVNTQQKDMSIAAYYTKLKGLWDEYNAYSQIPPCTCGSAKAIAVEKEKEKVHQFLMGLNEKYNVKSNNKLQRQEGQPLLKQLHLLHPKTT
ncbi:uncharacterized protein LOC116146758 [Pistacia vera]|uniref:uncharacterized protein LOC116146758 n=1 Tax=Pistacia vera TaxID=55513 RepID=UPI0012632C2E|nr:uncharacterized protein LOC116146758 [Pistacia vera]